jgi:hypothetical protein
MEGNFKELAKIITAKTFLDIDEIATTIKVYFEIWLSTMTADSIMSTDIAKRRKAISSKLNLLTMEKNIIEKQVLTAKSRLREKKKVDTAWLARANLALRIKKCQMQNMQDDFSLLRAIEKENNMKKHNSIQELMCRKLYDNLKAEKGDAEALILVRRWNEEVEKERAEITSDPKLKMTSSLKTLILKAGAKLPH